jgi:putative SOS response-associated peptidase YedK
MPVIVPPADYDLWLDPELRDLTAATEVLTPFDVEVMRRYPVSERVNIVNTDDSRCSEPINPSPPAQVRLF